MFFRMCDKVERDAISHKFGNVDTVNGSVKHIMFGHCWSYGNVKILEISKR